MVVYTSWYILFRDFYGKLVGSYRELREYWKECFFDGGRKKYDTFLSESISMLLANGLD